MITRRPSHLPDLPAHLRRDETWDHGDRVVEPGDEFHVRGHRGRFRFRSLTTNLETGDQWIDAFGPVGGQHGEHRAFRPELVTRVHRDRRGRR